MPAVRRIVQSAAQQDYRLTAIIKGVIASDQFRKMSVPAEALRTGSL